MICGLLPRSRIHKSWESLKKIATLLQQEIEAEVERIVRLAWRDRERQGHLDLESLEMHIRASMQDVGSVMLEKLINSDGGDYRGRTLPCEKGAYV